MEKRLYLKWLSVLCALMALFGIAVFAVGYKSLSVGRVATVVALLAEAAILAVVSRSRPSRR